MHMCSMHVRPLVSIVSLQTPWPLIGAVLVSDLKIVDGPSSQLCCCWGNESRAKLESPHCLQEGPGFSWAQGCGSCVR